MGGGTTGTLGLPPVRSGRPRCRPGRSRRRRPAPVLAVIRCSRAPRRATRSEPEALPTKLQNRRPSCRSGPWSAPTRPLLGPSRLVGARFCCNDVVSRGNFACGARPHRRDV